VVGSEVVGVEISSAEMIEIDVMTAIIAGVEIGTIKMIGRAGVIATRGMIVKVVDSVGAAVVEEAVEGVEKTVEGGARGVVVLT